jgi:uncharacterized protein (TIGR03437 family)
MLRRFPFLLLGAAALYGASVPTLAVDATASQHPISPLIYGINEFTGNGICCAPFKEWTDSGISDLMHIGVRRWGGDSASSYNWQLDVENLNVNLFFTTYLVGDGVHNSFDLFHERNLETGTASLSTFPMLDWIPKLPPNSSLTPDYQYSCSFPVSVYGQQQKTEPGDAQCGNGIALSTGNQILNDPNDVNQPITPAFGGQWVAAMLDKYGPANDGGVQMWDLDNEPEWWDGTHPDTDHQVGVPVQVETYDDMLARNLAAAQAVKAADPTALVVGPVAAGWPGYLFSKKDFVSGWGTAPHFQYWANPVDRNAHGGAPWLVYYLQQMQAASNQAGTRLLDYLDVHGYVGPCVTNDCSTSAISFGTAVDPASTNLRMQSTRAFWDPNYIVPVVTPATDSNPCDDYNAMCDVDGQQHPPMLVPRLISWVNQYFPGTKTAITEYDWGALEDITGAVAQADLLGIFGAYGLDMATMWPDPNFTLSAPGLFAFQIYLNYDGAGNHFGETSVSAMSSDPDTMSIFAAQRADSALTVMVLNKSANAITDSMILKDFTPAGTAQVWQYSSANLNAITQQSPVQMSGGSLSATFPAYSITLFIIPASQSAMTVPQPVITSVRSAASYDASGVAPGEFVEIIGQSLAPQTQQLAAADPTGKLPTTLGGVRVLFNGYPAPVDLTSPGQINAVVPFEAALFSTVNVQAINQGNASDAFSLPVVTSLPGMFTAKGSGSGQAAVLNQNNSVNSASNPEQVGNILQMFATGDGSRTPPEIDGRLPSSVLTKPALACSVTIGGLNATVTYCGAAPGLAGLFQINVKIPEGVAPGNSVPVQVTVGTATSQSNVTIAIQ